MAPLPYTGAVTAPAEDIPAADTRLPESVTPLSAHAGRRWVWALLRFLLYVGPLLAWMALIYLLSTELGGFEESLGYINTILDYWVPPATRPYQPAIDPTFLMQITLVLRRYAAVLCYGVLLVLSVRALQYGRANLKPLSVVIAVLLSAGFAAMDLWHRQRVPNRHGTLDDLYLNLTGIALFLGGTLLHFGLKRLERHLGGD